MNLDLKIPGLKIWLKQKRQVLDHFDLPNSGGLSRSRPESAIQQ